MLLQSAQTRRVGRADVEHDVIGDRCELPKAVEVVRPSFLERSCLGFTEIDANRNRRRQSALTQTPETCADHIGAIIIEAEPVDQRLLFWVTKNARPRISRLRFGGHGADLDEAKPERLPGGNCHAVLVEAGGKTDGIREAQPEERARLRGRREGTQECERAGNLRGGAEQAHGKVMRRLWIHPEEKWPNEILVPIAR